MKTVKYFGSTILLCLFVVACAKSNKEDQARIADQGGGSQLEKDIATDSRAGARDEVAFDITKEGYTSKSVVLAKNAEGKTDNSAQIMIFEEDARKLYERLKVTAETPDVDKDLNSSDKIKQGKNLACKQFTSKTSEVSYSCIVHLDFRTGKLKYADQAVKVDAEAKVSTTAYTSNTLSILEGDAGNGIVSVSGTDAKVLFDTLSAEKKTLAADGWLSSQEKQGTNLRCYRHSTLKTDAAPSYTCSLSIDVNDGTVKSSDVVKAVDTKSEEAAPAATEGTEATTETAA